MSKPPLRCRIFGHVWRPWIFMGRDTFTDYCDRRKCRAKP